MKNQRTDLLNALAAISETAKLTAETAEAYTLLKRFIEENTQEETNTEEEEESKNCREFVKRYITIDNDGQPPMTQTYKVKEVFDVMKLDERGGYWEREEETIDTITKTWAQLDEYEHLNDLNAELCKKYNAEFAKY